MTKAIFFLLILLFSSNLHEMRIVLINKREIRALLNPSECRIHQNDIVAAGAGRPCPLTAPHPVMGGMMGYFIQKR